MKKQSLILMTGVAALVVAGMTACGPVRFSKQDTPPPCATANPCVVGPHTAHINQDYPIAGATNKVDILFVIDNSGSMAVEQQNLGQRFSSFIGSLYNNGQPLDWQVGVTTTNVCVGENLSQEGESAPQYCPAATDYSTPGTTWETVGAQGSLLPLVGASGKIITPSTPNANSVFQQTVQMPADKVGSGDERPIYASNLAIEKRGGDNAGFFRQGAALAIVMLTDEDERSSGGTDRPLKEKDQPQSLINNVISTFGGEKSVTVHTINVRSPIPGTNTPDQACKDAQNGPQGPGGNFGTVVQQLATMTNGKVLDICSPPYDLAGIGGQIVGQTNSILLAHEPIPGTLVVKYKRPGDADFKTGAEIGVSETLQGRTVYFTPVPPAGTTVRVSFDYNTESGKVQASGFEAGAASVSGAGSSNPAL